MSRLVSDETWVALTIWQEARSEAQEGRVAVAEVIRNRMARKYNSDGTAIGTVLAPYQFSGWNTRDKNRILCARLTMSDPMIRLCFEAWYTAQGGSELAHGAVLYLNPKAVVHEPEWVAKCREVAVIGRHHFYVPA